jgi:Winged helix-turn helix
MDTVLNRLKLRKKVPRPRNAKASEEVQEGFKKGA